ncbi:MAG: type II toxin-antitoxin system VapC family toxin [Sulfolobales archaeon]
MYLLDSSAIINLVKRGELKVFARSHTLDLALYESLNAIWKEVYLVKNIKRETGLKLIEIISKIFSVVEIHTVRGSEKEIFELSLNEGLTIYDASYIYIAMKEKLMLVTDDKRLREIASKYVKALSSVEMIE